MYKYLPIMIALPTEENQRLNIVGKQLVFLDMYNEGVLIAVCYDYESQKIVHPFIDDLQATEG